MGTRREPRVPRRKVWGSLGIGSVVLVCVLPREDDRGSRLSTQPEVVPMHRLDPVEVLTEYTGTWAPGFEIADETCDGYRVRRVSDGVLLRGHFQSDEIRGQDL